MNLISIAKQWLARHRAQEAERNIARIEEEMKALQKELFAAQSAYALAKHAKLYG